MLLGQLEETAHKRSSTSAGALPAITAQ
jgi:hypothetical protein